MCNQCHQNVDGLLKDGICSKCETTDLNTVKKLQLRIAELEFELQRQMTAAEKGDKLIKVMWGDNFNIDSLH